LAMYIGSNATVRERVRIGDYSMVGAGAVVISDVPENTVVVGNPGRVLRTRA
jgi:acetyltransferase-like isoleucine patch superfamily enzyme